MPIGDGTVRSARLARGTREHYEDPRYYDFEYGDQREDVEWYCELASKLMRPNSVMTELGAGTGRITFALAERGHHVVAVDRMPPMLDLLREKLKGRELSRRVDIHCRDITQLPVGDASQRLVIAPFNVLQHLYDWHRLDACFDEVRRVLEPGGYFAFDVLLPDIDWLGWDPTRRHTIVRFADPDSGRPMFYSTRHRYDPNTQVCHIQLCYDRAHGISRAQLQHRKPERIVELAHRQIFPEEIRMLAAHHGFRIESHAGSFDGSPLETNCESQIVVCRKRRPAFMRQPA